MTDSPITALNRHPAHFDVAAMAIIVERMVVRDGDVVREAQRWTSGERGLLVEDTDQLGHADLTNYVTEALRIGAHALSVTGQVQETKALERMLKEVGDKTADSTIRAAEVTGRAVKEASAAVSEAANAARKAITEVDTHTRQEFTAAVSVAKRDLSTEVNRLFGGESPELLDRLRPLLDKFSTDLDAKVSAGTRELLAKAAKQFDPADPTSPMAKHTAALNSRQEELTQQLNKNHADLAGKVDQLSTALKLQEARTTLAKVTPIKGDSYARQIHTLMREIAGGLGDEYDDTGTLAGRLPRCKKGDGVLTVEAGLARVVLEVTDSARVGWNAYLDEAERNRDAVAALGLVRVPDQNGGQTFRVIGPRRVVMAFDPGHDDPDLLRTVVMLLRTAAVTVSARKGGEQIATAEEKINEALGQLAKLDSVKKLAGAIQKNAAKIDSECTGLNSSICHLLDQALAALTGAGATTALQAPVDLAASVQDGAAGFVDEHHELGSVVGA